MTCGCATVVAESCRLPGLCQQSHNALFSGSFNCDVALLRVAGVAPCGMRTCERRATVVPESCRAYRKRCKTCHSCRVFYALRNTLARLREVATKCQFHGRCGILHSKHFTLYIPHSTLDTPHLHSTTHTLHFTLYSPHVTLYTPHFM